MGCHCSWETEKSKGGVGMVYVGHWTGQPEARWGDVLPPVPALKVHSIPRARKPKARVWETSGERAVCRPLATRTSAASCRSQGDGKCWEFLSPNIPNPTLPAKASSEQKSENCCGRSAPHCRSQPTAFHAPSSTGAMFLTLGWH